MGFITLRKGTTPGTPDTGYVRFYPDPTTGELRIKREDGQESVYLDGGSFSLDNSVLVASNAGSPFALTLPEGTVLGRLAGGNISALDQVALQSVVGTHNQNTDTGTDQGRFHITDGTDGPLLKRDGADALSVRGNADADWADLIVRNLTVKGTTTTIDSETVAIADNILTLNSDVTGTPPATVAGIEVERGDETNARLVFDEGDDTWKAGIAGAETRLSLAGHGHVGGDIADLPWTKLTGIPTEFSPAAHVASHKTGGTDALAAADVGAYSAVDLWRKAGISPVDLLPVFHAKPDSVGLLSATGLTTVRASTRTYIDAAGAIKTAGADEIPVSFDPVTGKRLGWGVWASGTNLYGYGEAPQDQTLTLTATPYTVSCAAGSVVCGSYGTATPASPLTFTPSAGNCLFTLSAASRVQVEAGVAVTPYIPTSGGVSATRQADVASLNVADIAYNQAEGTLYFAVSLPTAVANNLGVFELYTDADNFIRAYYAYAIPSLRVLSKAAGVSTYIDVGGDYVGQTVRFALSFTSGAYSLEVDGAETVTATPNVPVVTTLYLGCNVGGSNPLRGYLEHAAYYARALSSDDLKRLIG
ncbi:hypothetical protein [Desulfovibrio inopinatus]|uniref:hypothetical protein n=1 Tax=Desulfovibrio inopinatus TaxID=102109 RepID=UPI0003FF7EED|nr:hypothetical protein [Desulfovibrio inopinatus]